MTYGSDDSQLDDPVGPAPSDQPPEPSYIQGPPFGQAPGYGQPSGYGQGSGYGRQPSGPQPYGGAPAGAPPPTNLTLALVSLLFCWPASVVAIIYASQVKNRWLRGDQQGAMTASRRARTWATVSVVAGILLIIYWFAVVRPNAGSGSG
jgi:Interferon-induced transmembrane protein